MWENALNNIVLLLSSSVPSMTTIMYTHTLGTSVPPTGGRLTRVSRYTAIYCEANVDGYIAVSITEGVGVISKFLLHIEEEEEEGGGKERGREGGMEERRRRSIPLAGHFMFVGPRLTSEVMDSL